MAPRRILTDSPFDTLEKTFDLLVTGRRPLALDGTGFAGPPDRPVPRRSSFDFVGNASGTPGSNCGGRPRHGRSKDRQPSEHRSNHPPRR